MTVASQDPEASARPHTMAGLRTRGVALRGAVLREQLVLAILAVFFLARHWISRWNSFWLDELLSVNVYGQWHDTAMDAVRQLAEVSIHPPLYQFTLYHWLSWFGDSEVAARSLSNVYITVAALLLYLLVRDAGFARRVALASTVAFSLMYTPTYYAMEARSYAQTIMLATASAYLLLRLMRRVSVDGWKAALYSPAAGGLVVTNTALLLTHYYNVFLWAAQAILVAIFVLRQRHIRGWLTGLAAAGGMYVLQAGLFALVWGSVFVSDLDRRAGAFELEGAAQSPLELFRTAVLQLNVTSPRWAKVAGTLLLVLLLARTAVAIARGRELTDDRRRAWTVWYLAGWMLLPLVLVWAAFSLAGVGRYSSRYFMFCVIPLAPLIVLAVEELYHHASSLAERYGRTLTAGWAIAATVIVVGLWVLPGGHDGASETKHDWRGIATQINDMVRADEESTYVLYETSHRRRVALDHYFDQLPGSFTPHETLVRNDEAAQRHALLEEDRSKVEEYDYLVIAFTHSRTTHYPYALEELGQRYEVRHRQLNRMGRGFIVYDLNG